MNIGVNIGDQVLVKHESTGAVRTVSVETLPDDMGFFEVFCYDIGDDLIMIENVITNLSDSMTDIESMT